jgi:hypothetical protein
MCIERDSLMTRYIAAAEEQSKAAQRLMWVAGMHRPEEFEKALAATVAARIRTNEARLAFERHTLEHQC